MLLYTNNLKLITMITIATIAVLTSVKKPIRQVVLLLIGAVCIDCLIVFGLNALK